MNMHERFSKFEKRRLRELAAEAHESALSKALEELYEEFLKWADDGLSTFDLNEEIHKFHDGLSRDLYRTYVLNDPALAVAIGLSQNALGEGQIGPDLFDKLRPLRDALE